MQIGTFPGWHGEDAGDPPKIAVCRLHMQTRRSRSYCVSNYAWFSKCDMHFEKLHERCPSTLTSPVPFVHMRRHWPGNRNILKPPERSAARLPFRKVVALRLNGVADACASQRRESRRCRACARPARPRRLANRTQRLAPPCRHTQLAVCLLQITIVDVHGNMIWN